MAEPCSNRPSDTDLRRLYVDERRSAESIADEIGVQKITVLRWLHAAGIKRRAMGRGLANRDVEPPTADELRHLIHTEHLSYRAIAERYGVDFTAIPFWLDRHGIERPTVWGTRKRGKNPQPDLAALEGAIAAGQSLNSIAQELGVRGSTVSRWCRDAGLPVMKNGWQSGRRLDCDDGHEARSIYEQRVDNWLHRHGLAHEVEPAYPWDRRYHADFLVGETFIEVWGVTNNAAYTSRKAMKIARCAEADIPLVQIERWQFAYGRRWWAGLQKLRDDS